MAKIIDIKTKLELGEIKEPTAIELKDALFNLKELFLITDREELANEIGRVIGRLMPEVKEERRQKRLYK